MTKIKKSEKYNLRRSFANEWFDSYHRSIFFSLPKKDNYAVALYFKCVGLEETLEIYSFSNLKSANQFRDKYPNSSDVKFRKVVSRDRIELMLDEETEEREESLSIALK
ncbi:MAG: hypothetical protein ACP5OG_02390 [Candidatus Nanoarchaeia archaeon]